MRKGYRIALREPWSDKHNDHAARGVRKDAVLHWPTATARLIPQAWRKLSDPLTVFPRPSSPDPPLRCALQQLGDGLAHLALMRAEELAAGGEIQADVVIFEIHILTVDIYPRSPPAS